jgi:hypothetical protein
MAWALAEPDVSRDDCFEQLVGKMVFYFSCYLMGQTISLVKHGQYQSLNIERFIE